MKSSAIARPRLKRARGLVSLALPVLLAACPGASDDGARPSLSPSQSPTPTATTTPKPRIPLVVVRDETKVGLPYSIKLPAGWSPYLRKGKAPEIMAYSDRKGHYLKVLVWREDNPPGSDFSADVVWDLEFTSSRRAFTVKKRHPRCTDSTQGACPTANRQLEGYALRRGEDSFVDGHAFQFEFGFTHAERGVDLTVYEAIIEAFRVK